MEYPFTPVAPHEILDGQRVRLTEMPNDPQPIPVGTEGTILRKQPDMHHPRNKNGLIISMNWDNGRTLNMIWPDDKFEIIAQST